MQLINAIVNMPEDFEFRIFLRNEFMRAGLYGMIDDLKQTATVDLAIQVEVFLKHKDEDYEELSEKFDLIHNDLEDTNQCFEIIQHLVADTPADPLFLAILQHLICIRDDHLIRYINVLFNSLFILCYYENHNGTLLNITNLVCFKPAFLKKSVKKREQNRMLFGYVFVISCFLLFVTT